MKYLRTAFLLTTLALISGCAAVALTAGGIAGGTGVDHTLSGIAYKTFTSPLKNVRRATLRTLSHMEIQVTEDRKSEDGWNIEGTASDREIGIELEFLTPNVTRMRVVVEKGGFFFKDGATGTEIIIQTAEQL